MPSTKRLAKFLALIVIACLVASAILTVATSAYISEINPAIPLLSSLFIFVVVSISLFRIATKANVLSVDAIYAFEFSVILLGGAPIVGVLSLKGEVSKERERFLRSEAEYYAGLASDSIAVALSGLCEEKREARAHCDALEIIAENINRNPQLAHETSIENELELVLTKPCCAAVSEEPDRFRHVRFLLARSLDISSAYYQLRLQANKRSRDWGYGTFTPWAAFTVSKVFLLFLGAIAVAMQFGLVSHKYTVESQTGEQRRGAERGGDI